MKRLFHFVVCGALLFSLCACQGEPSVQESGTDSEVTAATAQPESTPVPEPATEPGENTPITLTIGGTVLNAYLNDSVPAKSLLEQLPVTVTLNDSGNDFCGGSLDIDYSDSDIQNGYQNGELAFWPPASNFVIFVDDEKNSQSTDNLVILGKITELQAALDALEGTIDVTIARADAPAEPEESPESSSSEDENELTEAEPEESEMQIKITANGTELIATLEDNATTRALLEQMPMTLPMMDLYGREMCYRYGAYALPTDNLRSDGYEVGDLAYWAPGGSLVILYEQNGEQFERQHLGHIDSGVELFESTGDVDVTFEIISD